MRNDGYRHGFATGQHRVIIVDNTVSMEPTSEKYIPPSTESYNMVDTESHCSRYSFKAAHQISLFHSKRTEYRKGATNSNCRRPQHWGKVTTSMAIICKDCSTLAMIMSLWVLSHMRHP
jgi:hypothetical protein